MPWRPAGRYDAGCLASVAPFSTSPQGAGSKEREGGKEGRRGVGGKAVTMCDSCCGSVRWTPVAFTCDSETVLLRLLSFASPDAASIAATAVAAAAVVAAS